MTDRFQAKDGREIVIREACPGDVPGIAELWKQLMDWLRQYDSRYGRTPDGHKIFAAIIADCIEKENSAVFVAETDERIVGYCICHLGSFPPWTVLAGKKNGSISDMAVAKDCRQKGIGHNLFRAAKEWFTARGACRIDVDGISTGNSATASFWRKMGLRQVSEGLAIEVGDLPSEH